MKNSLMKAASSVAGLNVANLLITLATGIILARSLGPENYGKYSFVLACIAFLGIPTKAGLPTLVIRETAINHLQERWGYLRGLLSLTNIFVLGYSCAVGVAIWGVISFFSNRTSDDSQDLFLWALPLLVFIAFGNIRGATLRGLRKPILGQLPETLVRPAVLGGLLAFFLLMNIQLSPVTAMQLNVIASLAAFLCGAVMLFVSLPKAVLASKPLYEPRVWAASLIPLSLFSGLKLLDTQLIILFIGVLGEAEHVAYFSVASQGAMLVALGLTAVNMVVSPEIARLYRSSKYDELQSLVSVSTRIALAVAAPIAATLIVFGEAIVDLVFGSEYRAAAGALAIMAVGQLVNVSCGSVSIVLNMTGFERYSVRAILASITISVASCLLFIPGLGVMGAAIAYSSSLIVWNLILVLVTRKTLGINTFVINFPFMTLKQKVCIKKG